MSQTGELGTQLTPSSLQKASQLRAPFVRHSRPGSLHLQVLWVVKMVAVVYCGAGSRTESRRVL